MLLSLGGFMALATSSFSPYRFSEPLDKARVKMLGTWWSFGSQIPFKRFPCWTCELAEPGQCE